MHIGIDVSISLCSPWQFDITRFLSKVKNTLRISVANTLMNRMILDASLPHNPFGNPLIPDMIGDPSIVEIDGTFYCYVTTDGYGNCNN